MKARLPLIAILASSLTFLASLYLTWDGPAASATTGGDLGGLLNLLSSQGFGYSYSGWATGFGGAAALCALALCAGAGAALARPALASRLPLARGALTLLFLAVMALVSMRAQDIVFAPFDHRHDAVRFGGELGLVSATAAALASVVLRAGELRRPSPVGVLATCLTGGLLASFLVPDVTVHTPHAIGGIPVGYELVNTDSFAAIFTAATACLALPLWRRGGSETGRLAVGGGLVLLAASGLEPLGIHRHWPWDAWLWLGCALGLLVLAAATARGLSVPRLSPSEAWIVGAGCVLLISLFLPWGPWHFTETGWGTAAEAGALTTVLVGAVLGWRRLIPEIGLAVGFWVMAAGFRVTEFGRTLAYGSIIGFVATGVLLLAIGVRQRNARVEASVLLSRVLPIGGCLGLLAVPIVGLATFTYTPLPPWWDWLLLLAAVVIDFRLLGHWLGSRKSDELVLLPLVLLALLGLDLIDIGDVGIHWEGWLSLGLCVLLVALGWVEQHGRGLERFRIPEAIWRVDRISGVEE